MNINTVVVLRIILNWF